MKDLEDTLNRVLIDGLPQGVKDSIDRLLTAGEPKPKILAHLRASVRRVAVGDPNKGQLTLAAAEAYLESK